MHIDTAAPRTISTQSNMAYPLAAESVPTRTPNAGASGNLFVRAKRRSPRLPYLVCELLVEKSDVRRAETTVRERPRIA